MWQLSDEFMSMVTALNTNPHAAERVLLSLGTYLVELRTLVKATGTLDILR